MREEERAVLEGELLSLRHHLHEAEAAIAVRICRNFTNTIYQHFLPAGTAAQWAETSDCDHHPGRFPWPLPLRPLSGLPARAWCLLVKTPDWKICSLSESQNFTWLQCHLHCTITWSYHKNFVEEKCYEFICCFHNSLCSLILAQSCRPIAVPSYLKRDSGVNLLTVVHIQRWTIDLLISERTRVEKKKQLRLRLSGCFFGGAFVQTGKLWMKKSVTNLYAASITHCVL